MKKYRNLCWVVVLFLAVSVVCLNSAYAQQEQVQVQQENKFVKFMKDVVKWPFSITKQAVGTVGRTGDQALTTVSDTGVAVVQTVTGKPEKIKDVVVTPVKGSVDTGYTAVEGSINTPIKGTKEAFE